MAASVLKRRVTEEDMVEANKATEKQVAMIFSSMSEPGEVKKAQEEPKEDTEEEPHDEKEKGTAENVNLVLEKPERKTRRVQLVMTESVYKKSKAKAESMGMSLNDYIHTLLSKMD